MNTNCATYAESLARLAEGHREDATQQHVDRCARCAAKLEQLRAIVSLAGVAHYNAPEDLIRSVQGLMAPKRRVLLAGILRSSLASSGARSLPETAQLMVGAEDHAIRLMVRRQGEGYELFGELPSEDWRVESDCPDLSQDGIRFRMLCEDPAQTAFTAETEDLRLEVPAIEELLTNGTGNAG